MPTKIKVTDIDADASTSAKGLVQLTGCLGGTATSPTVVGLTLNGTNYPFAGDVNDGQILKRSGASLVGTNYDNPYVEVGGSVELVGSSIITFPHGSTSSSGTFTKPAGTQSGDILVMYIRSRFGAPSAVPSGFTQVASVQTDYTNASWYYSFLYVKTATGSEPSTYSYTAQDTIYASFGPACLFAFRNANDLNPIGDYSLSAPSVASSGEAHSPGITTTEDDTYVVHVVSVDARPATYFSSGALFSGQIKTSSSDYNEAAAVWGGIQSLQGASGTKYISPAYSPGGDGAVPRATFWIRGQPKQKSLQFPKSGETPNTVSGKQLVYTLDDANTHLLTKSSGGVVTTLGHPTKFKTADETVNSSTAMQDDNHLTFAVGANEKWAFEITAPVDADAAPGIKVSVNGPASPTAFWADIEIKSGTTIGAHDRITTLDTAVELAGATTDGLVKVNGVIENGANAGTVAFRFAQQTSDAGNTTVKRGAYIVYRKIG